MIKLSNKNIKIDTYLIYILVCLNHPWHGWTRLDEGYLTIYMKCLDIASSHIYEEQGLWHMDP